MNINVLIVDDEQGIRTIIKKILDKSGGFEVIGDTDNGEEAIGIFKERHPDVVFFDIEMPGCSGIECAKILTDIDPKTIIIFATAHQEYMSDAFQLYAFDYLVKPFKIERLMQTLDRIKKLNKPSYGYGIDKIIKHEKGLVKMYAMISVQNYNIVGIGETLEATMSNYIEALSNKNDGSLDTTGVLKEDQGTIERIGTLQTDKDVVFYIITKENPTTLLIAPKNISKELPLTKEGDKFSYKYIEMKNADITLKEFDNLDINIK